jgi:hypothetical protein
MMNLYVFESKSTSLNDLGRTLLFAYVTAMESATSNGVLS